MKKMIAALAVSLFAATTAMAAATCADQATEKKLAGAAKTSFMKKCEKDAAADSTKMCESQAADKKLAGAAKTSFVKKCVADAAAPAAAPAAPKKP